MNETYLTANDVGAVVCAAFLVVGLTPMFLPTMIVASRLPVFWWRRVGVWLRELKPTSEKAPDNS